MHLVICNIHVFKQAKRGIWPGSINVISASYFVGIEYVNAYVMVGTKPLQTSATDGS